MPIAHLENIKLNYLQINSQADELTTNERSEKSENIVMIHGLATNLAFWYPVANQLILRQNNNKLINTRITLFDLPGHGRSSMPASGYNCTRIADKLNQLLDYLEIDKFHLIAHSFGGSVAVDFARQFPEKIKTLILADVRLKILQPQQALPNWQNWKSLERQLQNLKINLSSNESEAGLQLLTEIAQWQINQAPESEINLNQLNNFIPWQQNKQTAKKWLKLIETTEAIKEFQQPEAIAAKQLAELDLPIFSIYGSNSPNLQTKNELEKIVKFNTSYIVENAGHFFPLSQSNIFLQQITPFLQKHSEIK